MIKTTKASLEKGALIKLIADIEAALKTSESRTDIHALRVRPILEAALKNRKQELVRLGMAVSD